MGSFLARLTCYLKLPHLKPHTCTSKDILQWFGLWAHILGLLLPLVMWSFSWKILLLHFRRRFICPQSKILLTPPHIAGALPPLPIADHWSWQRTQLVCCLWGSNTSTQKNSKALVMKCLLTRCPKAASQWHPEQFIPSFLWLTW